MGSLTLSWIEALVKSGIRVYNTYENNYMIISYGNL